MSLPITDPTWIFLLVLLIILFAPMLLSKLHIPHLIGMILAGLALGEHGFNILARDSSFELFGKVGLYYIMFLAGLEMDMEDFKQNRTKAVVLGLLTFGIPIGIGLLTNLCVLKYGLLTSILLASVYASHTLVAYPIVIRYGVSRQRSVSIAVGATAITDTLTLLVLAVVSGMFKDGSGGLFWVWLVVKVILLSILIIFLFPRIGRWFFRRYTDAVMQFVFVLAMVFLGAGLMQSVGMEGILGAFLAGLVLNRLIPHTSPLMNHLEFVGNALFIPYFLIGVGMLIDLKVIFGHGNALPVAGVMIVIALAGKWIACWLTQTIYGMKSLERNLMYGLSSARAAATLAAVLVGYNIILPSGERLLNDDVLNGIVLLILVTCIVSSLVTERAARKMAAKGSVSPAGSLHRQDATTEQESDWQQRTRLLLGKEKLSRLQQAHVLIVGVGGVGAYAAEMICRAGVGRMTIVDADTVQPTNINRQLPALHSTVGEKKTEVLAARLRDINPDLELRVLPVFLTEEEVAPLLDAAHYDFVVDAIDTLAPKCRLIAEAQKRRIRIVSSMGAGAKSDISRVCISDLWETYHCPLSKAVRRRLQKMGIRRKLPVVFSTEQADIQAIVPSQEERNKKSVCGTVSYLPAVFGCYLAEYVIKHLTDH